MLKLYSALTFIIAFTGCISLFMSGEINGVLALPGTALVYGYYRSFRGMAQAPKKAVSLLSAITLLIFIADAFIISHDYLISVANLTILFQAIKSYDLKEPWDNLQVYFMSLLQLIITSELTHSLAFGALFMLFLIAFVIAMMLAHFQKEGVTINAIAKKGPLMYHNSPCALGNGTYFHIGAKAVKKHLGKEPYAEYQDGGVFRYRGFWLLRQCDDRPDDCYADRTVRQQRRAVLLERDEP